MRMRARAAVVGRLIAAAALAVGGSALAGQAPALAAACSGTSGVTVVVDFGSSVVIRCAPGDPGSGLAALAAAGFSVTQVQRFPGAVCRIDGAPAADPCVNMPPADAYWAYFHAQRGGSWSYSQQGAGGYNPAPGSVEGWSFGSGSAPDAAPPAASASPKPSTPPRATTSSRPRPSATSPRGTGSSQPAGTLAAAPRTTSSAASAAMSPRSPSGAPSTSTSTTTSGSGLAAATAPTTSAATVPPSSAGPSAQAARAGTTRSGSGTLLAGGGLVAVLGGAAAYLAWRRRATGGVG